MTGVIDRVEVSQSLSQLRNGGVTRFFILQMEAAHQNIRLKPRCQIADSLVGAAADEDALFPFPYQQVLLVAKILRQKKSLLFYLQSAGVSPKGAKAAVAAIEGKIFPQRTFFLREDQPRRSLQGGRMYFTKVP